MHDGGMPNAPKTPIRTLRVAEEVWEPARQKAAREGRSLSEVIREFLIRYSSSE